MSNKYYADDRNDGDDFNDSQKLDMYEEHSINKKNMPVKPHMRKLEVIKCLYLYYIGANR